MTRVERAGLGDVKAAFRAMYTEALAEVYGFVSLRVGGDRQLAEDITAETFTTAMGQFRSGNGDEVTIAWLKTVARRRLIDHWRRRSVASDKVVVLAAGVRNHVDPNVADRRRVTDVLGQMPEQQRAALVMQHIEGHSVAEIARTLGKTEKATESLLTRARASFRQIYREGDDV